MFEETDLPLFTSDVKQEVKIRMGTEGESSIPPQTVLQNFDKIVLQHGNDKALFQKIPVDGKITSEQEWTSWTWTEYRNNVDSFAKSLISIGFNRFDMINIIGFNAPEWFFANFGAIAAGGVPSGIYATNNPEACQYVTKDSKAKVVVCEGVKQLKKYYEISKNLPNLKALVMYGPDSLPINIKELCSIPCYTFAEFMLLGKDIKDDAVKERSNSWKPGETCTLIYTSGTTGPPKAVMITNDNITWTIDTMLLTTSKGHMNNQDKIISYLPLSHIAGQLLDMHMPMQSGCQLYFAQPDALKGSLGATLKDVRPTAFFGVPRVYEKIFDKLQQTVKSNTGIKKLLFSWATGIATQHWDSLEYGSKISSPYFLFLANMILHQVRVALGFDYCNDFYVGAAPIEIKILKYFQSINVPIMELFGQSECTGVTSDNTHSAFKIGTVGRPLLGTEMKLEEGTNELYFRGRNVCAGYMGMPDKTSEIIDDDGWLHSGDVAMIDENHDDRIPKPSGFIAITGRIKELIITAGGENIPPVLIEDNLKEAMNVLSNVMVIGDRRKFLSVLLCLQVEIDSNGVATNKLTGHALDTSKKIGSSATTTDEAMTCPKWKEYLDNGVKVANSKATSHAQTVGKWTLLSTDFTEHGGELTSTSKLKRSVTHEKYQNEINAIYA